jgi:hypothetical protein
VQVKNGIKRIEDRFLTLSKAGQALCLILFLVLAITAHAQVDQGAITGTVRDSTGAVIPNSQVTLTSIDSGLEFQHTSNGSGVYVFSPVKITGIKS